MIFENLMVFQVCFHGWSRSVELSIKEVRTWSFSKLRSPCWIARSVEWYFLTDVSVQIIGLVSKGQAEPLKMGKIGWPEASVRNYHSTLRKLPKERRSHLHSGGSMKTRFFELLCNSYILFTVHLVMILGKWPTWRTILFMYLFQFSTCFEQPCAHHQGINCINTTSGIYHSLSVTVSCTSWPAHETVTDTDWYIPVVVVSKWILLLMSTGLLKTCRELE